MTPGIRITGEHVGRWFHWPDWWFPAVRVRFNDWNEDWAPVSFRLLSGQGEARAAGSQLSLGPPDGVTA